MSGENRISIDDECDRNSRTAALTASIGLSALFLVVYSGTNWITSLRSDIGTWYFEWERWILDLTAPTPAQLQDAIAFIARQSNSGTLLVHCKVGYSRSATVVGAYLLAGGHHSSADEVMAAMRSVRPGIVIRPEAESALRNFERDLRSLKSAPPLVPAI